MRKWIRLLALVLLLLLAAAPCAYADFAATVTPKTIAVYSDSDMTNRVGTLKKNTIVAIRSTSDGTSKIAFQGKTGYVAQSSLKKLDDASESAVVNTNTRVYTSLKANSSSSALKKGTTVNLLSVNGTRAMIENNGYIGYTFRKYLTVDGEQSGGVENGNSETTPSKITKETFKASVSADSMAIYKSDSTSSKKLATLSKGAVVTVVAYDDTWARLKNGKYYGFCLRSSLTRDVVTTATPEPTPSASSEITWETFNASVSADRMAIYRSDSTSSKKLATLSKGTTVTVVAYDDTWARLKNGKNFGFCLRSSLTRDVITTATPEPTPTPTTPPASSEITWETFQASVSADSMAIYNSDSTSAKKLATLSKGTTVTVVAYDDTWARLKNGSNFGFSLRSSLERGVIPTTPPTSTQTPEGPTGGGSTSSLEEAIESGKYSNEQVIFLFLTKEMKLTPAAACGILSNIKAESSFRPTAYNPSGGSYGICQWTGGRKTRLQNYCSGKGYDYKTLAAQLYFLEYELENHYTKTLKYIRGVENSADGAYDAAYYWCYNFEVPANRATVSVKRGNTAKNTYWPKYI